VAFALSHPDGGDPPSRFRPPETVAGAPEIFTMEFPYRKYFLGLGNNPGGRNRARRQRAAPALHGPPGGGRARGGPRRQQGPPWAAFLSKPPLCHQVFNAP
jgi:hypothetical protein